MEIAGVSQPRTARSWASVLYNVESGIITTWVRNVGDELTESFVPARARGSAGPGARAR